jgi:hypothetical protein
MAFPTLNDDWFVALLKETQARERMQSAPAASPDGHTRNDAQAATEAADGHRIAARCVGDLLGPDAGSLQADRVVTCC